LQPAERTELVGLAEAVWAGEQPIDWAKSASNPGPHLRALDQWIMHRAGQNITLESLYQDIGEVCRSRIAVAADKGKKTKKKHSDNIGGVADAIAKAIIPKIQFRNFPDDFTSGSELDMSFNLDRRSLRAIRIARLLGSCDIELVGDAGKIIYEETLPSPVAEAIARSVLWGRSAFSISSDPKIMNKALADFGQWALEIENNIATAIAESALGTGYEDSLRREIYSRLGIHPLSGAATLPDQISLASDPL
jgi:hypothetical protein